MGRSTYMRERATSERGASSVEYVLLLLFVAAVCIAAVTTLGSEVADETPEVLGTQIERTTTTSTGADPTTPTTCAGQSEGHGQGSNCR